MARSTLAPRKEKIIELLSDDNVKTIVLVGEPGIGKTWTAREITRCAIKDVLFDIILWVFLNREYESSALRDSIGHQLCLLPTDEEWESEDDKEVEEKEIFKDLQHKISAKLEGKSFLLVLDDEGNKMDEDQIMSKLKPLLNLSPQSSYKVLITSAKSINNQDMETREVFEVKPLSMEESLSLLRARVGTTVYEIPAIKSLAETFIGKAGGFPASVLVLAKALSYFGQCDSGVRFLETALEEASNDERSNITQLLCTGDGMLPLSVLIDCCRHGNHFFRKRGRIHYNELIAYWMVEGYLGRIDSIEKAYEKGHHILMELIDCQILKKVEADYIIMEGAMMNFDDYHHCEFGGTPNLGLANVLGNSEWEGLGKISWKDGTIKTICSGKQGKILTLMLDGNHLGREVPDIFFDSKKDLQVLVLFNPTLKSLPRPLCQMDDLRVLVLRGCEFLEKIDHTQELKKLTVLEISGATSLKTVPDDFPDNIFQHMPHLRSLNMSAVQIDKLPSSLYDLSELCWLILRGCSSLVTLESLRKLNKLAVLDLSGATSLTTVKDKTFGHNKELKMLDLSHTQIKIIPKLPNLVDLTHLSLSGCKALDRLPDIRSLSSIQYLDLSGAEKFKEFHKDSLDRNAGLQILNLSETGIEHLPSHISNPRHLFLKRCSQLKSLSGAAGLKDLEILDLAGTRSLSEIAENFFEHLISLRILNLSETSIKVLPSIGNLCNLRQLDLSGCSDITTIKDESFEQMSCLQKLDLSGTKIKFLPSLSNCCNLRHLLLTNCTDVKVLSQIELLSKLEELNLCGINMKEAGANFLEQLCNLQMLDLSETQLEQLPTMANLKNLRQLSLRGCRHLKMVPDLEALTKLEVLDLSRTAVESLPSFNNFGNLRSLMLTDCVRLKDFQRLEILDLLGATEKELPYGISKLTCLEHLDLPNMIDIQISESEKGESSLEEPNQYQWSISSLPFETPTNIDRSLIPVSGTQFLQVLEKNPSLLETSFKRFHFCVHPVDGLEKDGDRYFSRSELIFRDIRLLTRELVHWKEGRSLEICGFDCFPEGIEDLLSHADCLLLIDSMSTRWLSDLGASNLKVLRGCWIERCRHMESVFHAEDTEDIAKVGKTLDVLGVSNAFSLKSIYSGNQQCEVFQNLKCLYLDCCPKLSTVFPSSQLPVNLKVLHIKFCDKLESVVDQMLPDHPGLLKLDVLHLWELPQLKSIGCKLPSLQTLKVWQCPKLQKLEEYINLAESMQILWISSVPDLKSIYSGVTEPQCYKNLKTLILESCSMLVNVFSSPQPPRNLETLKIKSCDKLETVFEHSSSLDHTLPVLRTLHLQSLPKLKKIGGKFPSLQAPIVNECPDCRYFPVA